MNKMQENILVTIILLVCLVTSTTTKSLNITLSEENENKSNTTSIKLTSSIGNFLKSIGVADILKGVGRLIGNIAKPSFRGTLDFGLGNNEKKISDKNLESKKETPMVVKLINSEGSILNSENGKPIYGILVSSKDDNGDDHHH